MTNKNYKNIHYRVILKENMRIYYQGQGDIGFPIMFNKKIINYNL